MPSSSSASRAILAGFLLVLDAELEQVHEARHLRQPERAGDRFGFTARPCTSSRCAIACASRSPPSRGAFGRSGRRSGSWNARSSPHKPISRANRSRVAVALWRARASWAVASAWKACSRVGKLGKVADFGHAARELCASLGRLAHLRRVLRGSPAPRPHGTRPCGCPGRYAALRPPRGSVAARRLSLARVESGMVRSPSTSKKHALDLDFVTAPQPAKRERRSAPAARLHEIRLGDADLCVARLQAGIVQERDLHRLGGPERLGEQLLHTADTVCPSSLRVHLVSAPVRSFTACSTAPKRASSLRLTHPENRNHERCRKRLICGLRSFPACQVVAWRSAGRILVPACGRVASGRPNFSSFALRQLASSWSANGL